MQQWKVRDVQDHEGPVPYGPAGDRLPARFTAVVEYADRPIRLTIQATFDGLNRVRAHAVSLERVDGESVSPEDMAATRLAAVMGSVVCEAAGRRGSGVAQGRGQAATGPPTDAKLLALTRTYWLEYVSWGKPRQAVMEQFDLPRSTANYWIRKARERYGLPGRHADNEA